MFKDGRYRSLQCIYVNTTTVLEHFIFPECQFSTQTVFDEKITCADYCCCQVLIFGVLDDVCLDLVIQGCIEFYNLILCDGKTTAIIF